MKSNSVRAAGIVLAVILGVAALLYLGGLISQLTIGYQKWLADGGMTGCWRSAMTGSGLKCTFFTAVLAGGLFAFVRLQNRFGSNDYDPRNFTRSKRGTYGTSGWMRRHPACPVPEHPARRVGGGRGSKVGDVRRHGGAIQEARL